MSDQGIGGREDNKKDDSKLPWLDLVTGKMWTWERREVKGTF